MIDQSKILSHSQVQFITLFFGGPQLCCAFYQTQQAAPIWCRITNSADPGHFDFFRNKFYCLQSHTESRWKCSNNRYKFSFNVQHGCLVTITSCIAISMILLFKESSTLEIFPMLSEQDFFCLVSFYMGVLHQHTTGKIFFMCIQPIFDKNT